MPLKPWRTVCRLEKLEVPSSAGDASLRHRAALHCTWRAVCDGSHDAPARDSPGSQLALPTPPAPPARSQPFLQLKAAGGTLTEAVDTDEAADEEDEADEEERRGEERVDAQEADDDGVVGREIAAVVSGRRSDVDTRREPHFRRRRRRRRRRKLFMAASPAQTFSSSQ